MSGAGFGAFMSGLGSGYAAGKGLQDGFAAREAAKVEAQAPAIVDAETGAIASPVEAGAMTGQAQSKGIGLPNILEGTIGGKLLGGSDPISSTIGGKLLGGGGKSGPWAGLSAILSGLKG